jgi:hypothetical protein
MGEISPQSGYLCIKSIPSITKRLTMVASRKNSTAVYSNSELREIDQYYLNQHEPAKSCLLALRKIILNCNPGISEAWKYRMPFFCYHGKMFCYLWIHKKFKLPYIGIVEGKKITHPKLIQEKRARMKILLIDPEKDIPVRELKGLFREMLVLID